MKQVLYLILVLVLCSFALAAPPFEQELFTGDTGLNVNINIMPYYQQGLPRWSVIHVFNQSNGMELTQYSNPDLNCTMYLRDSQGFEIMRVIATPHNSHWDLNGSSGGNNIIGDYAWTLVCNDDIAEIGGFASGFFKITNSGKEPDNNNYWLVIIIALSIMTVGLGFIGFMIKDKYLKKLKAFFFLLFVVNVLLLGCLPLLISLNPDTVTSFLGVAIGYFSVNLLVSLLFIYLYSFHLVTKVFKSDCEDKR